jgi:hypothetical protein
LDKYTNRTPHELDSLSEEEKDEIFWCFKAYYIVKESKQTAAALTERTGL